MPLRSVEAATRDDAIAAAREQFGPQVRIVGVRRVRSGGVLGFFATERYVAEVAPDVARPPAPTPPARTRDLGLGSSPLASATPATAAPSAGSRTGAPARNGAAAYAAEALRPAEPTDASPAEPTHASPASQRTERPATQAAVRSLGWSDAPHPVPDEPAPNELARLLAQPAGARAQARPRPGPRTGDVQKVTFARAAWTTGPDDDDLVTDHPSALPAPAAPPGDTPSPFTAALARMVAGDSHVQQAVREAVEAVESRATEHPATESWATENPATVDPATEHPATESWATEAPAPDRVEHRPSRPIPGPAASTRAADTAAWPDAARQEEETVGEKVVAPPSMPVPHAPAVEVPVWAAPEVAPIPDSSREAAIAEVLRAALAEGHSDEALAGILRRVLDGASARDALGTPLAELTSVGPAAPDVTFPGTAFPGTALRETPVDHHPRTEPFDGPVAVPDQPSTAVAAAPAPEALPLPEPEAPPVPEPLAAFPAPEATPAPFPSLATASELPEQPLPPLDIWGTPASASSLWGEPVPRLDAEAEAEVGVEAEFEADVEADVEADAEADAEADVEADAEADVEAEVEAEVEVADSPIWAEVLLGEPAADTDAPTDAPTEAHIEPGPEAGPEATAEPEPENEAESLLGAEAELEPEDEAENEADSQLEADAEPGIEAEVEVENEPEAEAEAEELPMPLARTASDPAPHGLALSMASDATSVMPPLSLLPPLPSGRGRGRPPVPPSVARPPASRATEPDRTVPVRTMPDEDAPAATAPAALPSLATVTRLPVVTLPGRSGTGPDEPAGEPTGEPQLPSEDLRAPRVRPESAPSVSTPSSVGIGSDGIEALVGRLTALGLPQRLLGNAFPADVERLGVYAALTRALGLRLPAAPEAPSGPGEVLFVVGPGVETLRAARSLAASLCLDPDRVQWATRGDLAGLAAEEGRMTTIDAAIARRHEAAAAGTVTIVAVDAPMRTDAYWMAQMLAVWSPVAVWAVVEATRKPEDVEPWLGALSRVDALVVQDTDLSADPAAVLHRVAAPVALLDGVRATPHRWASLLCERLEGSRG